MGRYVSVSDTPGAPPLCGGMVLETEPTSRNRAGIYGNRCNDNDCCV